MSNVIRKASFALIAIALLAGASVASHSGDGIEVLGIEVLKGGPQIVHVHTIAPPASPLVAIANYGFGDVIVDMRPVSPLGFDDLTFPVADPHNRIELIAPDGIEVLDIVFVSGFGIEGGFELD